MNDIGGLKIEKKKKCHQCGKNRLMKAYYSSRCICKKCWILKNKDYYRRKRHERMVYAETYREDHREELRIRSREYRKSNPEKIKAYNRKYWRRRKKDIEKKRKEAKAA